MIQLPDFGKAFEYENNFYLSCETQRISKMLCHYELFKKILNIPGEIIECGVFKGCSLIRFAIFRELLSTPTSKKIIGFDAFDGHPRGKFRGDANYRKKFVEQAGEKSISIQQLIQVLHEKGIDENIELIAGDIAKTVSLYAKEHPELKISLLHLDCGLYGASQITIKYFYPRIVKGGLFLLNTYSKTIGETRAIDEYFAEEGVEIRKLPFCYSPSYIVKG